MEIAILGAGCFWCIEALFSRLSGVNKVISGYCNGKTVNPTYESVCSGTTGHAEVCKISYDKEIISYSELLTVLFQAHNPTTLNKQGADTGTQYRSAIFYTDDEQKNIAEEFIDKLVKGGVKHVILEVSSHALSLNRMDNISVNFVRDNVSRVEIFDKSETVGNRLLSKCEDPRHSEWLPGWHSDEDKARKALSRITRFINASLQSLVVETYSSETILGGLNQFTYSDESDMPGEKGSQENSEEKGDDGFELIDVSLAMNDLDYKMPKPSRKKKRKRKVKVVWVSNLKKLILVS